MDRNKVKRPRSTTPSNGDKQSVSSPLKKKSKKEKVGISGANTKSIRFRSDSEAAAAGGGGTAALSGAAGAGGGTLKLKKGSGSTTATADGQIMAQMLSTFSKQEESRFEAFQRSSFQADAIEEFVAACICHRHGIPRVDGEGGGAARANSAPLHSSPSSPSKQQRRQQRPRLQDLVSAPGPTVAQDVVIVVSTLAKIYAQRLVSAAVQISNARQARQQQQQMRQDGGDEGDDQLGLGVPVSTASSITTEQLLEPQDVLDAYRQRVSAGLDPGFYLQGHDGISTATTVVSGAANTPLAISGGGISFSQANHLGSASAVLEQHRRLAALLMQEAFDKSKTVTSKVHEEGDEVEQRSEADVSMDEADVAADTMDMEVQTETKANTTAPS